MEERGPTSSMSKGCGALGASRYNARSLLILRPVRVSYIQMEINMIAALTNAELVKDSESHETQKLKQVKNVH